MDDQHPRLLSTLVDRLRGDYTLGVLPKDREVMGGERVSRKFETAPICHEAADRIEQLEAANTDLVTACQMYLKGDFNLRVLCTLMRKAIVKAEGEVPE